jgi:hypothetical protein
MIRMIQSSSAGGAKAYFSEALSKSDYYINDQELQGDFKGKLAERLGIAGPATKETFFALCENVHPATGKPLTPRTKEERTVGYDVNFHAPKSVSVLHVLSKDDHVLEAFQASVKETMQDMEADSATRVRIGGQQEDRQTGELAWADLSIRPQGRWMSKLPTRTCMPIASSSTSRMTDRRSGTRRQSLRTSSGTCLITRPASTSGWRIS